MKITAEHWAICIGTLVAILIVIFCLPSRHNKYLSDECSLSNGTYADFLRSATVEFESKEDACKIFQEHVFKKNLENLRLLKHGNN